MRARHTIGSPIFQALPEPHRSKPVMIKVAPKIPTLAKSESEQLFDPAQLSQMEEEDEFVGDEFDDMEIWHSQLSSEKVINTETSDKRDSQGEVRTESKVLRKSYSGDKHDADTNISAVKNSRSSGSVDPKDEPISKSSVEHK